jgi:hypothetical protein
MHSWEGITCEAVKTTSKNNHMAEAARDRIKLSIRLTTAINRDTRAEVNKQGELSDLVTDAIWGVDLRNIPLVVDLYRARDRRFKVTVKQTQVSVTEKTYNRLRKAASVRGCSMNCLVNNALTAFLREDANRAAFEEEHED